MYMAFSIPISKNWPRQSPPICGGAFFFSLADREDTRFPLPMASDRYVRRPEPDHNQHHVARKRRCLKCGVTFPSEWAGERICPECKGNRAYRAALRLDNHSW